MNTMIPTTIITPKIILLRDKKVILDKDLSKLYEIDTSQLSRQVRRNIKRFPLDFMFQLTKEEFQNLMCQNGISSWGGTRKLPYAFTEHGVAMLSGVLNSNRAIQVNIQIIRTFIQLKQIIIGNAALKQKIENMERKYDKQFLIVFDTIKKLLEPPRAKVKRIEGFSSRKE